MVLIRLELDHRRQEVPLILSFCSERRVQHVAASNSTTGWQFENQVTYFQLFFICVNTLIFLLQPLETFYNCQSSLVSHTHKQDNMGLHFVCVFMSYTRHRGWSQSRLSHLLHSEDYGWPITLLLSLINEDNELLLLPTKPWCSSAGEERERGVLGRVWQIEGERVRKEEIAQRNQCEWRRLWCLQKPEHRDDCWPWGFACTFVQRAEVCLPLHLCVSCLLTTSSVSVGPLQRLGRATVTDAPDCQLVSIVKTTS